MVLLYVTRTTLQTVWVDESGAVARYNLAYVNHSIFPGDNGLVIGFDNQHGYHHRHLLGIVEGVEFRSFEEQEARFDEEWSLFVRQREPK